MTIWISIRTTTIKIIGYIYDTYILVNIGQPSDSYIVQYDNAKLLT